ncbi:Uncharacterised protein [Shigella sonnei]|uniref:hypothetical protein n=1 Tax=Shigella sonnei TaxID=624 RepID=UPI0009730661|nr:hypothetical protein [Shigella sonnei]SJK33346.1 Uncharacterised protein [Shigella sonnei]
MKKYEYMLMKEALWAGLAPCPVSVEAVVGNTIFRTLRNRVSVKMVHQPPKSTSMIYLPLPEAIKLMRSLKFAIWMQTQINKAVQNTFVKRLIPELAARCAKCTRPALQFDLSLIQQATEAELYRLSPIRDAHTEASEMFRLMFQFNFAVRRTRVQVNRMMQEQEELTQYKGGSQ